LKLVFAVFGLDVVLELLSNRRAVLIGFLPL
jgi:hypothetical protein